MILTVDSITHVRAAGHVVVNGSHGGIVAAAFAVGAGVRAAIFNDAGVGREGAGISGLAFLDQYDVPAATIGHETARIGDGADMMAHGVITYVNEGAARMGIHPGQRCATAAACLETAPPQVVRNLPVVERRTQLDDAKPCTWLVDSASQVKPTDSDSVVITGSHGGLLGGRPETAIKASVLAAVYNDAGIGRDGAGISRLPVLEQRGIAGATVCHDSARIGDAQSTYEDGIISSCNAVAEARGVFVGQTCRAAVVMLRRAAT